MTTNSELLDPLAATQRLCSQLDNGDITKAAFMEACTRLVTLEVGCSRTGIWRFLDTALGRTLRCVSIYDGIEDHMTTVADEVGEKVGPYFMALEQTGYVVASDARAHFATAVFFSEHLRPNGVSSLLAVSFAVNGAIYGAFTCTQVGAPVEWTSRQLSLLRQIAFRVSLALASAHKTTMDTVPAPLLL